MDFLVFCMTFRKTVNKDVKLNPCKGESAEFSHYSRAKSPFLLNPEGQAVSKLEPAMGLEPATY